MLGIAVILVNVSVNPMFKGCFTSCLGQRSPWLGADLFRLTPPHTTAILVFPKPVASFFFSFFFFSAFLRQRCRDISYTLETPKFPLVIGHQPDKRRGASQPLHTTPGRTLLCSCLCSSPLSMMTAVAVSLSILLVAALFPQASSSPCEYSISHCSSLLSWGGGFSLWQAVILKQRWKRQVSKVRSFSCFL